MNNFKWLVSAPVVICSLLAVLLLVLVLNMNASGQQAWVFMFRTYPGLVVALASGFFGATFSMLLQTQRRTAEASLDDLSSASSWRTLMVRSSVGLGGAAILYFFFRSGLLGGNLWPDLSLLAYEPLATRGTVGLVPNQHWCLLVIWCFLGGFSETLVPNILSRTEEKASTS
jgi:uncharacterized integral membrane protein